MALTFVETRAGWLQATAVGARGVMKARALMERKGATAVVRRIDRLVAALD